MRFAHDAWEPVCEAAKLMPGDLIWTKGRAAIIKEVRINDNGT